MVATGCHECSIQVSPPLSMKLLCPVKKTVWGEIKSLDDLKNHIAKSGQFFGQDLSGPACDFNASYPCDKTLYEYMGWGLHQGLDIPCASGTEVYASHDGIVTKLSDSLTQGIGVVITKNQDCATVYWHLKSYNVVMGQEIKAGDLIALSDNTGYSKGNHLHWEYKIWTGNGYQAVDPIPHIIFNDMRFVKVGQGGVDVWMVVNGSRSLVYNALAFSLISGNWSSIEIITQAELDAIPDTGKIIVGADQN